MDMQRLGDDLDKALRILPRPLVEKLFSVVGGFKNDLGNIFPVLLPLLLPHAMAALPEWAGQCLDTEELGKTIMAVFENYLGESKTPVILQAGTSANDNTTNG
jgi:hypothetical protein